jgi:hypothetical protein
VAATVGAGGEMAALTAPRYRTVRIDNAVAKRVVEREHYLHTFPRPA